MLLLSSVYLVLHCLRLASPAQVENTSLLRPNFFKESTITDFENGKNISVVAFGSCNKQTHQQPLWKHIIAQKPDLWIWLGDAVYADTRLMPLVWTIASLGEMQQRYQAQKQVAEYKELLDLDIPVIGVWDDHDYGADNGNKHFKYRLRSQDIFLDFLDEPLDSLRRSREGTYVSYVLGTGKRRIKIILLDVRSNAEPGNPCDILGTKQWDWLEEQLADKSSEITMIGSGMQFLSDIPFIEKWQRCPASLDKLVWLTQKRKHVFFLSGDVHFSEVNCMNSSSSGYPLYEVTSSSLTHSCSSSLLPYGICDWTLNCDPLLVRSEETSCLAFCYPFYEFTSSGLTHVCSLPPPHNLCKWFIKNVVASCFRVSSVVTEINFGIIRIDWNTEPVKINFELHGENGILTTTVVSISDLEARRNPAVCPPAIEQPNWYWKRVFWYSVVIMAISASILAIWLSIIACRWFIKAVLKDLDVKIKNGFVKLSKKNKAKHE